LEAAFRNLHSRLRSHAESIAFFGGGLREGSIVVQSFQKLLGHLGKVIDIRCPLVSPYRPLICYVRQSPCRFLDLLSPPPPSCLAPLPLPVPPLLLHAKKAVKQNKGGSETEGPKYTSGPIS